jgi:glycosyltransferase involved in cell wall biosynthesis
MALLRPILRERPSLLQGVRLIYDAEALFATRAIARASFEGQSLTAEESDKVLNEEVALADGCDAIICVTDAEADAFRAHHTAPVYVLSHPAEPRRSPGFEHRLGFLFVGRLLEPEAPNWRGLNWFIREVWPKIRSSLPLNGQLIVAGHTHHPSSELHAPGVRLIGPAADLDPIYDAARVFVAPINFAAGVPIKILEATAAGLPTVGTRLMARQLSWIPGIDIAAEDEPSAFAAAALALHEDEALWDGMRTAAQKRVELEHSINRFRDRMNEVLRVGNS